MRKLTRRQQIAYQLGLAFIAAFVLLPIWGIIYLAFDSGVKGWPTTFRVWPEQPSLAVFARVWERSSQNLPFVSLLQNSLVVSGGAAFLSLVLGASMAYAFARYRFPGRRVGLFGLLTGALLPPVALMTPLYVLLTIIGIRTSLFGLMIVYTAFAMPFCIWNMRAAFQAVSPELEESAFLDGAGALTTFWWVTLPLALPSIAVAGLIAFLIGYSEFAMGWLFVSRAQNVTLAMAIAGMIQGSYLESWSILAALAILMSLPVVVIFIILQRYLLDRLVFGTV
ncbi:MAG: carbohydrate ABC transporter permease [Chloroflexi bacterium]|nr:carbohydrate ABC transporter permease [Chloroflexota bacterium]